MQLWLSEKCSCPSQDSCDKRHPRASQPLANFVTAAAAPCLHAADYYDDSMEIILQGR